MLLGRIIDRSNVYFDRNNNFTECASSTVSRNSSLHLTAEIDQDDSYKSKEEYFPSIHSKYINNSKSKKENYNWSQNNASVIRPSHSSNKNDNPHPEEDPQSRVYIRNRFDKKIYLLEFKPTNVRVVPVYLKHRTFEENINDKCNQPYSKSIYYNQYNNKSIKFNQLKKTYAVDKTAPPDKVSIMSHKKPILPKFEIEEVAEKRAKSISSKGSNLKQSIIYIRYQDMYFEIRPGIMDLSNSELIDIESENRRKILLKELHMKLPTNLKNKASIIVKHNGDVLKFLFSLSEINYSKLKVTTSIGVMAKDDLVYVKDFSSITSRKVYISVPKTIYDYVDPMVGIKRKNMALKLLKIVPYWKEEQRKKRIKEYNQCRRKSVYEDLVDLKIGSRICYEGFQCLNKAKGGVLDCRTNDADYENWVISNQKSDIPEKQDDIIEKFETTNSDEVPDWDLVNYSK